MSTVPLHSLHICTLVAYTCVCTCLMVLTVSLYSSFFHHLASQWEWPSDQNTTNLPSSVDNSNTATPTSYASTTAPHSELTLTSKATPTDQCTTSSSIIGQKRSSVDTDSNQRTGLEPPPTKLISPYGAWTTVAVR